MTEINKVLFDMRIVKREDVLQWISTIKNPRDQFIILGLFEGIRGKDNIELSLLKPSDVKGNEVTLYGGRKIIISDKNFDIYFSPQDKSITNAVLPLIRNAKNYIYIPTFVLTEKRVTEELIKAKNRGVDVKIILDALNASIKHSKHQELRNNGVLVKTENYAGKMHSKSMIVDDLYTIIGSMNFSYSGENKNDENFIVIKDSKIAREYKSFFLHQWENINNKWLYLNAHAEGKDSIGSCHDGIDNDYDGYVDLDDISCK